MKWVEELCNALEAVALNPGITFACLQRATDLDTITLERYLRALIGAEFIERDVENHDLGERMRIWVAFRHRGPH